MFQSPYQGSSHKMDKQYIDAMAVLSVTGKLDFFITFVTS